ncbi:2-isopropylmalate synthase LeuA [Gottschalkia acidurici 9a]|uniref:2-isopropylmalate synthase n=1 Tax=Gottschalkia acidurici (strain ATCC 7906 / DSM 604 / BCRC 14475 / CIP 104303 / KCTC 5404 / NCIMB 10678 / 9a) TaxID=1128398 RepID=K0AYH3_GOTA9|nr:2-isopropylmalate synthase [Gottschalkia acidurici]AFS77822.1 2-isopropylmalate synthase LeuA [Gottschalkia acidurici 9a]
MKKILVFDTTLRDGEQVPGAKLNLHQKIEIAKQLIKLNVDIIEAGFPSSSPGDFKSVETIAKKIGDKAMITALARAVKSDITSVYESVKHAQDPLIHIVLGTSNVHVEKKFSKTKEQVLETGVEAVKYAKSLLPNVQYSTEDASRSDFEYLWKTIEAVVKAGATMINIPDTVGYAVPEEFGELIRKINYRLKNLNDKVILSVHCHNDTGLATANTLAAIKNGADKIECTINGIGERAGNTALEEVVMGLKLRKEYYNADTNIVTREIKKTSNLVSGLMGLDVQVNKAITGDNAFSHSSGIHQDGLLKNRDVYEVIRPEDVGVNNMELVLTARSGRHAFKDAITSLGLEIGNEIEFDDLFKRFLELADMKKEVYHHDLIYLIEKYYHDNDSMANERFMEIGKKLYEIESLQVISNDIFPTATVKIKKGDEILIESSVGHGPIDALYTAIKNAVKLDVELKEYKINSMSRGKDALGRVSIVIDYNGKEYSSKATETDIIRSSAVAFINGINSIILDDELI